MIPELKFSPANLKKHLCARNKSNGRRIIYTTRDKIGRRGQVYYIKDTGYFVLTRVSQYLNRLSLVDDYWRCEGFASPEEFYHTLINIYPTPRPLYVWRLDEVYGIEENRDAEPKRKKTYPKVVGWFWA